MTTNTVSTYLTYAQLQMAAEALLDRFGNQVSVAALTFGNNRSSRFSNAQAEQFAREWKVAAHQKNTNTGFSGTVFECLVDDPARGLTRGQLVMSFRSTEFADDAARDNEATNALEIAKYGWAFGQISDMQAWYESLLASGKLTAADRFAVTGYSLGGHLAAAFNQLMAEQGKGAQISETYTFNGAGVGELRSGTLTEAIDQFNHLRSGGSDSAFQTGLARNLYRQWREPLDAGASSATLSQALADLIAAKSNPTAGSQSLAELNLLIEAVSRAKKVRDEADRIDGGAGNDLLFGGLGRDTISAASANDSFYDVRSAA